MNLLLLFFFGFTTAGTTVSAAGHSRRILHQPFFPLLDSPPPPPPSFPSPSPQPQPKYTFSSQTPPLTHNKRPPFFPSSSPSPPPPSSATSLPTFPANISSLLLPHPPSSSSSSSKPISRKLIALTLTLSFLSIAFIAAVVAALLYHSHHTPPSSDALRLFPPNTSTSSDKPLPPAPPSNHNLSSTPAGTPPHDRLKPSNDPTGTLGAASTMAYLRLGSPELHPLPPLPRRNFHDPSFTDDDDDEFFSPKGSPCGGRASPTRTPDSKTLPSHSSPKSLNVDSQASPPAERDTHDPQRRDSDAYLPIKLPPPPPPLPPPGFWETRVETTKPPFHPPPTQNPTENEEISKPKLKPLHWYKVKASSDRAMVWDRLKVSSFQLNEEMIETLFMVNSSNLRQKDGRQPVPRGAMMSEEKRVLDPKKSQNIAILLRALNVTVDEVCECLLQGNGDMLSTELLENLVKMAPTVEEEAYIKEFDPLKLGPAEKFLREVVNVPFAFKRVEALLYISTFDSEADYLKRSFETLESACEELRNSRMLIKLLEAVLKTGNRMNVGTNRGDAHAFKLDTLLKLVDVKGADGKTTLLHFVVQEMVRAEGARLHETLVECRKLGLEVVSGLSRELSSVRKAAAMDYGVLDKEAGRLAMGVTKVTEAAAMSGSDRRFADAMNVFLKRAEEDIVEIRGRERRAILKVKEVTCYFHGSSGREETQPMRIFMVVRDFLSVLDRVCKEVGKTNERMAVSRLHTDESVFPAVWGV